MALLSAHLLSPKTVPVDLPTTPFFLRSAFSAPLRPLSSPSRFAASASFSSSSAATATAGPYPPETTQSASKRTSKWEEFARRVSGEWDGFGADFTVEGKPIELPEPVVPEAFREWGVQVFDWQTQCPTLAAEAGVPRVSYKLIRLLPTVGCEADAATRHSVDERVAGGADNKVSTLGYDPSGCYLAAWPVEGRGGRRLLELEHCLVDPRNPEVRVRVAQVAQVDGEVVRLEGIRMFSEQWYGPFRNGEQLGGCAIRESGFASGKALDAADIAGSWQSTKTSSALIDGLPKGLLLELSAGRPPEIVRDQTGVVTLPKQLWSSFNMLGDSGVVGEVGWLYDHGAVVTSRCVLSIDGKVKEMVIAWEAVKP